MSDTEETPLKLDMLPMVPLRNNVVMPDQIAPIGAGRDMSVAGLVNGSQTDGLVVLAFQREPDSDDITLETLYPIAIVCRIGSIRSGDGAAQAIVQGIKRVRLKTLAASTYWQVNCETVREEVGEPLATQALAQTVQKLFMDYAEAGGQVYPALLVALGKTRDPAEISNLASMAPEITDAERLQLMQELNVNQRLTTLTELLARAITVVTMQGKIQQDVMKTFNNTQREAVLRQQMQSIRKELAEINGSDSGEGDLKERIMAAGMPENVQKRALKEFDRLESISGFSPERGVVENYLQWLVDLPWKNPDDEVLDIGAAARILDEDHYGLPKVKERILEWMAVRQRVLEKRREAMVAGESKLPPLQTPILCLVGPPGVGKTSLGQSIARALNRKLARVSLGGLHDEAEIRGHRRTYVGSMPGQIIQAMRRLETKNVVMMLDEIDKVGSDFRGDPSAALLEVLDPEQNCEFSDHYLEVPYDLSQVLFITTANMVDTISSPLRDRMEIIKMAGYTEEEKLGIAKSHLIPRQLERHALTVDDIVITDDALRALIRGYTHEAGVRDLERQIANVMRRLPRMLAENPGQGSVLVDAVALQQYLGPIRFEHLDSVHDDAIGLVNGLVVSDVGGEVIVVEALAMDGRPGLEITGQIGDVMKESAQAGLSWARVNGAKYGARANFFDSHTIHIHVPAGAIPKEGPSAGVAIVLALVSVASERPVRHDVAMTGEITLRGRVLPIGGVRDKLLAAKRAGVAEFLLPQANVKDLYDVEHGLLDGMTITPVSNLDEVMERALLTRAPSLPRHPMGFAAGELTKPMAA